MVTTGRYALATVDLKVARGADNDYRFRYTTGDPPAPVDLTGWTARSQWRAFPGGPLWLTVTDGNGISLAADGLIVITVPHVTTETADWDDRSGGVWDLELTSPAGARVRLVQGTVMVSQDVTRDG